MNSKEISIFKKELYKYFDWLIIMFKVNDKVCKLLMHKDGVPQHNGEMDNHSDVRVFNYHFGWQWHNLGILNESYFYWSFDHIINPPFGHSNANRNYRASQISTQLIFQGKPPILKNADKLEDCFKYFIVGKGPLKQFKYDNSEETSYLPEDYLNDEQKYLMYKNINVYRALLTENPKAKTHNGMTLIQYLEKVYNSTYLELKDYDIINNKGE
tara:strand:+ start:376 stop:1014 length:639 start_codon:yes stop_codon:yes gene_type:complete